MKLTIKILSVLISICLSNTILAQKEIFTDDRDGQTYDIVEIGEQVWLASNLNYETSESTWYDGKKNTVSGMDGYTPGKKH
ncbi:MAG: hypothetical protein HC831_22500 [Chloroflexia bacterium]|nr:hypothetical protein [Chloroflexia bacterium]